MTSTDSSVRLAAVMARYTKKLETCEALCRRSVSSYVIVDNSPSGTPISSSIIPGTNQFREFSAYLEGAKHLSDVGADFYIFMNDTLFTNYANWKCRSLTKQIARFRHKSATIYGVWEPNFLEMCSEWFSNPNGHIRTDCFAVNPEGLNLLMQIIETELHEQRFDLTTYRHADVLNNFIAKFHSSKSGEGKAKATYIEHRISSEFFQAGLVVPLYSDRISSLIFSARSLLERIIRKIRISLERKPPRLSKK